MLLQVITCYGYVLELLKPTVEALASPSGGIGIVSLGDFSLASQPAMSSYVAMHVVHSLIHQLRDSIHLLVSTCNDFVNEHPKSSPPPTVAMDDQPEDMTGASPQTARTATSIQIAIDMMAEKETMLDERLSDFIKSPNSLV